MNRYKNLSKHDLFGAAPGAELDYEFSIAEEDDLVGRGWLEILPAKFRNIGGSKLVFDSETVMPGDEFEQVLPLGQQALLGSHIEPVKGKPAKKDAKG